VTRLARLLWVVAFVVGSLVWFNLCMLVVGQ
jgi:hypothetical protein